MKRGMAAVLIILLTFAVLIAAGTLFLLYRHFVTNRIMDGGRMENPDAQRDDRNWLNSNGVKPARRLNGAFPCTFIWRMRSLCWPAGSQMRRAERKGGSARVRPPIRPR